MNALRALTFPAILAVSISCNEPESVDPRDEWVGSYDYQLRAFNEDLTRKTDYQSYIDIVSYLHLEKSDNPREFNLKLDGDIFVVHGHELTLSDSGYTFKIEEQTYHYQLPDLVSLSGYANVEMDGGKHDGVLSMNGKRIHYFFKVVTDGDIVIIEVTGTRL